MECDSLFKTSLNKLINQIYMSVWVCIKKGWWVWIISIFHLPWVQITSYFKQTNELFDTGILKRENEKKKVLEIHYGIKETFVASQDNQVSMTFTWILAFIKTGNSEWKQGLRWGLMSSSLYAASQCTRTFIPSQ